RTAQLAYDLNMRAIPVMFSWPSLGSAKPLAYSSDETVASQVVPDLALFLGDIAACSGARKIHVLAHSMGSAILAAALAHIDSPAGQVRFNNVVLAAPDIDADVFLHQIAPRLKSIAKR